MPGDKCKFEENGDKSSKKSGFVIERAPILHTLKIGVYKKSQPSKNVPLEPV